MQTQEILTKQWHSKLNLVFAKANSTTQLTPNLVKAALLVQQSLYPEASEICHCVILRKAGGVVGGDCLGFNFHLKSNAQASITTVSAGKICRTNGLQARQDVQIQIDAGANARVLAAGNDC